MKNYSIEIDHENKLIRYTHKGNIKVEDIGMAWDEFLKMPEFTTGKYNLLSDYIDGKFLGTDKEIRLVLNILKPFSNMLKGKKQAMILSEPLSTALSMLFEIEVNNQIGFLVKVFSTKSAAFEWITAPKPI